jgi:alkanesulfonate monooxygenase SsuD/methylene tetrahydromethanopterin reductase-like flavin-dependent oxidoreductase (luciferase family)
MKPILHNYVVVPGSREERERLRPIGRNRDLYSYTIDGLVDIARAAESLGYWGMSFVEHHLHSEGFEVSPSPGILCAWLAAYTKTLRLGPLGYVLSTQHPLRVAEETATLDHILNGRLFVGFARGYQARWIQTMGQHFQAKATLLDRKSTERKEANDINQRIFREMYHIIKKAWTEDSISFNGEFFKIPNPIEGITDYPGIPAALRYGGLDEVGAQNQIQKVSIVPAPLQTPHPPIFVTSSGTPESAFWAGEQGVNALFLGPMSMILKQSKAFVEGSQSVGRNLAPGQNQGIFRYIVIGKTREEAYQKVSNSVVYPFFDFYRHFFPAEMLASGGGATPLELTLRSGLVIAGTVDDVKQQLDQIYQQIPFEYLVHITHYALEPKEELIEDIELLATKVLPHFQ